MSRSVLTFQSTFSIRRETLPVPDSTPQRCTFQSTLSTQELTAHSGARPEHARWQGQLVTLTGEDAGETIDGLHVYTLHEIGYGSGEGFKGWNCRHDWHAYYKGISKPNYTPEQIKKLNEKNISYNGKKYTKYEISQMQRQGERNVRALKRRTLAAQAAVENAPDEETKAVLQADYVANAVKLKESEKQLKTFCSQTGQRRDTFREQVDGFGRSAAQKAVHAAKRQNQQTGTLPAEAAGHAVEITPLTSKDNGGTGKTYSPEKIGGNSLTSGADGGIIKDERVVAAVESGKISLNLNLEKQNPHIYGTPAYDEKEHKSYFTVTIEELQEIVSRYHGTGNVLVKKNGQIKEIIKAEKDFGICIDEKTGKPICSTNEAVIHYSKKRTHIVPKRKDDAE